MFLLLHHGRAWGKNAGKDSTQGICALSFVEAQDE